jgi:hypothetical protein
MTRRDITRYFTSAIFLTFLLIIVAACAPTEFPPAVLEARDRFAEAKDIPVTNVRIVETGEVTWDDSCLEMGPITPEEDLCEEGSTPGWRIVLEANDEETTVRSDAEGVIIRWPGQAQEMGSDVSTDVEVYVSLDGIPGVTASQTLVPFEDEADLWEVTPQHIRVTLDGYPLEDTAFEPQLRVYKVNEIEAARGNIEQILLDYQQIRVAIPDVQNGEFQDYDTLVFIPLIEANQQFYAHPKEVDFQDGTGYRFLTQYSGEEGPVANDKLFYAYQGLTEDDNFIVTAILPVSHPDLDEGGTPEIVKDADPTSFTPALEKLDSIMQSVVLNQSQ